MKVSQVSVRSNFAAADFSSLNAIHPTLVFAFGSVDALQSAAPALKAAFAAGQYGGLLCCRPF